MGYETDKYRCSMTQKHNNLSVEKLRTTMQTCIEFFIHAKSFGSLMTGSLSYKSIAIVHPSNNVNAFE
uniref:Uncharacterized protein n=1 Tax=Rhizophagus irregularis (strain DAOM 181602 / DAOM 197198 / MUCL 43194) TaxID=747089 RepID=U9SZG0_RHIID